MAGLDAHRGVRDGLLAGAAEPVERDPRRFDRPTRCQHGHPADARRVITRRIAVADDDVVDIDGVDTGSLSQCVERLGEQLLGMDVVERTVGLALPTR